MDLEVGDKLLCRSPLNVKVYNFDKQSYNDLYFLTFGKRYEIEDIFFENGRTVYVIQNNCNTSMPFVLSSLEKYFVVGKILRKLKLNILNKKSK